LKKLKIKIMKKRKGVEKDNLLASTLFIYIATIYRDKTVKNGN